MIPNNNLSVLPWYTSIDQQNARKWWVYNRIYPLFAPALELLPFQVMRDSLLEYTPGAALQWEDTDQGAILPDGTIDETAGFSYSLYIVPAGTTAVYLENLALCPSLHIGAAAYSGLGTGFLGAMTPEYDSDGYFTGGWILPEGTNYIAVQSANYSLPIQKTFAAYTATYDVAPITSFKIYKANGELVGDYTAEINEQITVKDFPQFGYDVIIYPALFPLFQSFDNGQYYAIMSDGTNTWYSEVFTAVNDIEPYLKIEWYDNNDFVMDAGRIVYTNPAFKNVLYLDASIAKPEYLFEEEGETRDGYFFPSKQISEKRYRFKFLASEYLLDVMRFIRMADYATIYYHGQRYSLDTFLITPEWEDNGDVASVEALFDTATVAKKIGMGYIKAQRGDFNDDFNNDFNN